MEKTCSRCRRPKPLTDFHRCAKRRDGRTAHCKSCHSEAYHDPEVARDRALRRRYGIGAAEYDALYEAQGGVCALCGGESNGRGRLAVDHDHATGAVRGLLCFTCNTALGRMEAVGVAKVAGYLALERLA